MKQTTVPRMARAVLLILPFLVLFYLQYDYASKVSSGRSLRIESDAVVSEALSQTKVVSVPRLESQTLTLSYYEMKIKYPARAFQRLNAQSPALVAGVLSSSDNAYRRDAIRSTWGHGRTNVFFLVAGDWTKELEKEATRYQDIIWIDDEEHYRRITWKTLVFFRVIRNWVGNAQHILKTDDDSYVNMEQIEKYVGSHEEVNYMGYCMEGQSPPYRQLLEETYPRYASGAGYVISSSFMTCLDDMSDRWPSVADEDANTGIFARACGVSCQHDDRIFPWRSPDGEFYVGEIYEGWIHHNVKTLGEMTFIHSKTCAREYADSTSCTIGSDQTVPKKMPLFCNFDVVGSCHECVTEDPLHRDPQEICDGSCYFCPFAVEEPTRCIPKSQECVAPEDFKPRPVRDR
eukprot:scaffold22432_cov168-Amphora_coffeaeformis.AAC.22